MSFVDSGMGADQFDALPENLDPTDALLVDHYNRMMGDAADVAAGFRVEIDNQKGPFWEYLKNCRLTFMTAIARFAEIQETDVVAIREIKQALATYKSAAGFAQRLLHSYSSESDSVFGGDRRPDLGVGEPPDGEEGDD